MRGRPLNRWNRIPPQRVHIGGNTQGRGLELFGGGIGGRQRMIHRVQAVGTLIQQASDTEIQQFDLIRVVDAHVGRFQIAMHDQV